MKIMFRALSIIGLLICGGLFIAATPVNPVIDTSACTAGQPITYVSPTAPVGCVDPYATTNAGGQIPSMAAGRAPSTILSTTGTTVISTTAETSIIQSASQGPGTTITGGVPYVGNRFHLYASGIVTTPIAGGSATIKMKWGSVAVATLSSASLLTSLTNQPWWLEGYCSFTAISGTASSSTMRCTGELIGASATPIVFTGTSSSVDTTANQLFDATWTWASVVGSQTTTAQDATVEILY